MKHSFFFEFVVLYHERNSCGFCQLVGGCCNGGGGVGEKINHNRRNGASVHLEMILLSSRPARNHAMCRVRRAIALKYQSTNFFKTQFQCKQPSFVSFLWLHPSIKLTLPYFLTGTR